MAEQFDLGSVPAQMDQARTGLKKSDTWGARPASFQEQWGMWMMLGMLIAIIIATVATMVLWYSSYPSANGLAKEISVFPTSQPTSLRPEEIIDLLGKRQSAYSESFRGMFQLLVLSGLVPIFTLLAGYVFGKSKT